MSLEKLLSLDVSSYVEKKQGLSYLSWANAWREFIKVYPDASTQFRKTLMVVVNSATKTQATWCTLP